MEDFNKIQKFIFGMFIAWGVVVLLTLAGIAFVVYKVLAHFSIL